MENTFYQEWNKEENTTIEEALYSERFYLSGYETIKQKSTTDAVKSLLSSILPYEQKVLLLKTGNYKDVLDVIPQQTEIITTIDIELSSRGLQNIELFLETNKNVSGVMLCIEKSTNIKRELLIQLGEICDRTNTVSIIFDTTLCHNRLHSYLKTKTSYILYSKINSLNQALIIAQRRSLVKTEGISNSFTHNLYNTWQESIVDRKKHIKPMLAL